MQKKNCLISMSNEGDKLIVGISGEIDHHNAVMVRGEIDSAIVEQHPRICVLELSGINFMDSSGLGLIMGRYTKMKSMGGELILRDPGERLVKIFTLAGLERIVRTEYTASDRKEGDNEN